MKVLGVLDDQMKPRKVVVPDKFVSTVEEAIKHRKDMTIGGKLITHDKVFTLNLLDEEDWTPEFEKLVTPTPKERLDWNTMREQEWYKRSRAQMAKYRK